MKLIYPSAGLDIDLEEGWIYSVICENQSLFYELIDSLSSQSEGMDGSFVLSENFEPLDISKRIELITQLIPFTVNKKELLNKVHSKLKQTAYSEDFYVETQKILSEIEKYIARLTEAFNGELEVSSVCEIPNLLKQTGVRFHEEGKTLPEKLLDYMMNVYEYECEKLFVIVNLRSYLTDKEVKLLYQTLIAHKVRLLTIESVEREKIREEKRVIIDNDYCVI